MKIIVGLGNPGRKYAGTRHNVGFEVVADLVRRLRLGAPKARFQGECIEGRWGKESLLLLCPTTLMNLSGRSVSAAVAFYQVPPEDLLVICDDFHLPLGKLRFRSKGSAGGQKGLADIIRALGTESIPRLRVGIGVPPEGWDAADFVLSRFRSDEQDTMTESFGRAAEGILEWVANGLERSMNRFN